MFGKQNKTNPIPNSSQSFKLFKNGQQNYSFGKKTGRSPSPSPNTTKDGQSTFKSNNQKGYLPSQNGLGCWPQKDWKGQQDKLPTKNPFGLVINNGQNPIPTTSTGIPSIFSSFGESKTSAFPWSTTPTPTTQTNPQNCLTLTNPFPMEQGTHKSAFNPAPTTGLSPSIFAPNAATSTTNSNAVEELKRELMERDGKIGMLESQVKMLNQGLAMCINWINQNKNKIQTQVGQNGLVTFNPNNPNPQFTSNQPQTQPQSPKAHPLYGTPTASTPTQTLYTLSTHSLYLKSSSNPLSTPDLKIQTQNGKIIFSQPINISTITVPLNQWVEISEGNLEVRVKELRGRACQVFFYDFMGWSRCGTSQRKQEIVDRVGMAKKSDRFYDVEFDYSTGRLYARCKGF